MSWVDIVVAGCSVVAALAVIAPFVRRVFRHWVADVVELKIQPIVDSVDRIEISLATQFGGNGGGMRQAINELGLEVAELRGQFKQHVKEAA